MQENALKHGAFSWVELMTTAPDSAKQFYQKLFGWEFEEAPMGNQGYTMIKVHGDEVGGIMGMPDGCESMPPCWGLYVTVDNVDETATQVEQLGGKILRPPFDIPEVGRFCVVQDPQGAVIQIITYKIPS